MMIRGVSQSHYETYEFNKKQIEKNIPPNETSENYHKMPVANVFDYSTYQYQAEKQAPNSQKDDWNRFSESIEAQEESYGNALKAGYSIDNKEWFLRSHEDVIKSEQKIPKEQSQKEMNHKIDRIKERHDSMYYYGVQHQGSLTINDLYKFSFGGVKQNKHQYSKEQLGKLLGMNGLDQNQGNMKAASQLMSLGLDVSQDTVTKIQNMETAVQGLEEYESSNKQLEETTPLMEEEKILYTEKDIQEIVDELAQVDEETIGEVLGDNKEITIGNLREVLHRNTKKALGQEGPEFEQKEDNPQVETKDIKSQVNDIRAKLSVEAAQKISEKMPLESTELTKLAKELTTVQEEKIVQTLENAEVEVTPENKALLGQTLDAVVTIGRQKALAIELQVSDEDVTLEQIHQVSKAYEEQALEPEKRFGESLKTVEGQIEEFLVAQDIEPTQEMSDAARALIVNQLPLSTENLEAVVPLVSQMNVFLEEMTPHRAATLIKEGINPYKASIGNMLEWIAIDRLPEMRDSLGESILALEEKGKINDAQKQSLVGLYRILNGVQTHKFEVAGYLYKNELPMTVEKLQEAIGYSQKSQHIEVQVDDAFGELEKVSYAQKTSRMMLQEARQEQEEIIEYVKILENIELPIESEQDVKKYRQISQQIYPFIKQYMKEQLSEYKGIDVLPDSFKEKMSAMKDIEPRVIETMEKHEIPMTLSNIYWMQKLVKEPDLYQKLAQKERQGERNFPKTFEEIEEVMREEFEKVLETKEQAMSNGNFLEYRNYKQLEEMMGLQKELMQKEGLYHIPFVIDGESRMVELYIKENKHKKDDNDSSIKVAIAYDTKHLGKVNAYVELKDSQMKYEIFGETARATKELSRQDLALKKMLEKIGYALLEGQYAQDHQRPTVVEPMPRRSDSQFEVTV
ncbi:MAG: DUF6240 domain-containing protein [Cellulosilyticaceae bacterium]